MLDIILVRKHLGKYMMMLCMIQDGIDLIKMMVNAMHEYDLKELFKNDRIILVCYRCKVKIIDIAGISGLIVRNGTIIAICQNADCKSFVFENCTKVAID